MKRRHGSSVGTAAVRINVTRSLSAMLTRRRFLTVGFGAAGLVAVAACSSSSKRDTRSTSSAEDLSARFARYEAADEPNGDPSKVVWPAFVTEAGAEVKGLYEFQVVNGHVMRYMPCFCGCGQDAGHRHHRDCNIKQVTPAGSVVFDNMAPT
jgi:hypothetical protein